MIDPERAADGIDANARPVRDGAPPLIVVVGPTASGKTDLAVRLAQRLDGEVINADSVQIYRHFDIGSGKPTAAECGDVVHHLLDEVDPVTDIDAAQYADLARRKIAEVESRGKRPILCGGTFLWVRATLFGLAPMPPKDAAIRAEHERFVAEHGRAALHARLEEVDPAAHKKLGPNDYVRVSRALEVHALTGKPVTELQKAHGFRHAYRSFQLYGVAWSKEQLAVRIETRVRGMLNAGWVSEVQGLLARGYGPTRAMGAVGYRQVQEALESGSADSLDQRLLAENISRATRIFARRQRTWLREEPIHWLQPGDTPDPQRS